MQPLARLPDHLGRDRLVRPPPVAGAGEQIGLGAHPTPVLAQGCEQLWIERDFTVHTAFATLDANDHAAAIDVAHLQLAQLASSQSRRIHRQQHGVMEQVAR